LHGCKNNKIEEHMEPLITPRLQLVVRTPEEWRAFLDAAGPDMRAQLSPVWLGRLEAATEPDPLVHGFTALALASGEAVGQIGFKAPPADGVVEIAYAVEPQWQGMGYATEMAAALTAYALSRDDVSLVRAHTLVDGIASQRVLAKCGYRNVGEVVDPEDGTVLRFEKARADAASLRP
jgi:RimJ/RimL family protein N-acetyltransferase